MKKIICLSVLAGVLLWAAGTVFAVESAAEDVTDRTLAALEPSESLAAEEVENADPDAFREDDFFIEQIDRSPVAVVSSEETAKIEESAALAPKAQPVEVKPAVAKASPSATSAKKAVQTKAKPKTAPELNPQEMQKRWKALFSKEITPDSEVYTVKSGDSLYVIARKNHTTVDLIKKINGLKNDNIYPRMKLKIHTAPFSIRVDKSQNTLVLYSEDVPIKKYPVATGKDNCTPVGTFKITDKLVNPTWFKTGAILPPGSPKNALGTRWMGFDKPAYGIHGTIEPKSIGTQASEGCVRMLNEDVEELYSLVPTGTKVTIQD